MADEAFVDESPRRPLIDFNSGPNTFDVWDTTSNRYYRQSVDTRNCTHFVMVPTADGYDIQQIGAKLKDD